MLLKNLSKSNIFFSTLLKVGHWSQDSINYFMHFWYIIQAFNKKDYLPIKLKHTCRLNPGQCGAAVRWNAPPVSLRWSPRFPLTEVSVDLSSQGVFSVPTAVPCRRCGAVTTTPARFTTGRRDPGASATRTPPPQAATARLREAASPPAPWACRPVRSSVSGSTWDRCPPKSTRKAHCDALCLL